MYSTPVELKLKLMKNFKEKGHRNLWRWTVSLWREYLAAKESRHGTRPLGSHHQGHTGRHNIDSQIKGRFENKYSWDNYHRKPTCKLCVNSVMLKFCWNLISVNNVYHILTDKGATIIRMRIIYRPTCCIVIVIVFG